MALHQTETKHKYSKWLYVAPEGGQFNPCWIHTANVWEGPLQQQKQHAKGTSKRAKQSILLPSV